MSYRIYRSRKEAKRPDSLSWEERWAGEDKGLITCWEVGREMREKEPELAQRAELGELPPMGWKGGVESRTKNRQKYGTLYYLAQWQGLRGEDLNIMLSDEPELICSKTGVKVVFTGDVKKYGNA
jgi:hypothetical protein